MRNNMKPALKKARTTLAIMGLLSPMLSFGQTNTILYESDYDVKQYSTEICTYPSSPGGSEVVMAGTVYNIPSTSFPIRPNFLSVGTNGGLNYSREYQHPDFEQLRAVSIAGDKQANTDNTYYITCVGRPAAGPGNNDAIVILGVNTLGEQMCKPFTITPNGQDESFYPLHSIIHTNGDIYICGYYTNSNQRSGLPNDPSFKSYRDKYAFITRVKIVGTGKDHNLEHIKTVIFETRYSDPTTEANAFEDYDMAVRMKELTGFGNPAHAGKIFVTGGVNNVRLNTVTGLEVFRSGTMNVMFDENLDLPGGSNPPVDDHFAGRSESFVRGDEYGVDIVEDDDNAGQYFIVGNYYDRDTPLSFDINASPTFFWTTRVDNNLNHNGSGKSRYTFSGYDYAWAYHTIEAQDPPSAPYHRRLLIAGYETNHWCPNHYDENDVRAFLYEFDVDYNTTTFDIGAKYNKWTTYLTQTGTGAKYADPNSYFNLGTNIANISWNPTFATRETPSSDIRMSAPRWFNSSVTLTGKLNMKVIIADKSDYTLAGCLNGYNAQHIDVADSVKFGGCGMPNAFYYESVDPLGYGTVTVSTDYYDLAVDTLSKDTSYVTNTMYNITTYTCQYLGVDHYKPTAVSNITTENSSFSIYPNPASGGYIKVTPGSEIEADDLIIINLTSLNGQLIEQLYSGTTADLNDRELKLPKVASGIYIVNMKTDGVSHNTKVYIE